MNNIKKIKNEKLINNFRTKIKIFTFLLSTTQILLTMILVIITLKSVLTFCNFYITTKN